jgi:predicted nucleic acid-binding protein
MREESAISSLTLWIDCHAALRPPRKIRPILDVSVGTGSATGGQLARSHALRGADAVHLASALAISDPDLIIAVWDRRLYAGAANAGLRITPAQLLAT